MPSGRNQPGWAVAAQLKMRIFGYWLRALTRARSQACSFAWDQGPLVRWVIVFTHMTGSPWAADIISWIRPGMPMLDPTDTSAASLVPSANTQQPRYPWFHQLLA